jgi:Flp pilus assembly pilin Flp
MRLFRLFRNTRGAASVEFAFALPVLAVFMVGVLEFGQVLMANGALRNALGDGIRYAKVHPSATTSEVLTQTKAGLAGVSLSGIKSLNFVRGTQNGADYGQISISYQMKPMIPFAPLPPIVLNQTKTAYLPT